MCFAVIYLVIVFATFCEGLNWSVPLISRKDLLFYPDIHCFLQKKLALSQGSCDSNVEIHAESTHLLAQPADVVRAETAVDLSSNSAGSNLAAGSNLLLELRRGTNEET